MPTLTRKNSDEETEKGPEKTFEEIIVENFPNMGKESTASPRQDKCKEKHAKTHSNQIDKNQRQRKIIESNKGKTTNKKTNDRLTRKKKDRIFIIFTCTGVYRK